MSTKAADSRQRYYKNKDKDLTVSNIFIVLVWRGYLNSRWIKYVSVGMHRAACHPTIFRAAPLSAFLYFYSEGAMESDSF